MCHSCTQSKRLSTTASYSTSHILVVLLLKKKEEHKGWDSLTALCHQPNVCFRSCIPKMGAALSALLRFPIEDKGVNSPHSALGPGAQGCTSSPQQSQTWHRAAQAGERNPKAPQQHSHMWAAATIPFLPVVCQFPSFWCVQTNFPSGLSQGSFLPATGSFQLTAISSL